jgi:hypothetical protein
MKDTALKHAGIPRIIQHVSEEKFSVTMSRGSIDDMLHRWGFRYTRPTYNLKRANPQKEFQREMELIKNLSDHMVIIYEDENHIRDYQALRITWSVKGLQKQIPAYRHHTTVSLLGVVISKRVNFSVWKRTNVMHRLFYNFSNTRWTSIGQTYRDGLG